MASIIIRKVINSLNNIFNNLFTQLTLEDKSNPTDRACKSKAQK